MVIFCLQGNSYSSIIHSLIRKKRLFNFFFSMRDTAAYMLWYERVPTGYPAFGIPLPEWRPMLCWNAKLVYPYSSVQESQSEYPYFIILTRCDCAYTRWSLSGWFVRLNLICQTGNEHPFFLSSQFIPVSSRLIANATNVFAILVTI